MKNPCTCSGPSCPLLTLDGTLYSGTMNNFLGSEPILLRTLGPQPVLKTDTYLRWLRRKHHLALYPLQSWRPGHCNLLELTQLRMHLLSPPGVGVG